MTYGTFLLDLDHTLFDTDTSERLALTQTLEKAGIAANEHDFAAYRRINLELWSAVEQGQLKPQQVRLQRFERFVAEQGLDADPGPMADDFVAGLAANGDLYEGALEVLQQLHGRVSMGLVTNGLGEVQRARIMRAGIVNFFDTVVISAEVGVAKPSADIFDIVFAELGSPPRESTVMVGDSLSSDIAGGANYGIDTCWYNPRGLAAAQSAHVTHEIDKLEKLLGLIPP